MPDFANLFFLLSLWSHRPRRSADPVVLPGPSATKGLQSAFNSPVDGRHRSARAPGFWSAIILAIIALAEVGTAATVRIRLETTDLHSNVVSSVNVGEQFLLRGYVTDLRPNAQEVSVT